MRLLEFPARLPVLPPPSEVSISQEEEAPENNERKPLWLTRAIDTLLERKHLEKIPPPPLAPSAWALAWGNRTGPKARYREDSPGITSYCTALENRGLFNGFSLPTK